MRTITLILAFLPLLVVASGIRDSGIISPDHKLIAYTVPVGKDGIGSMLYVSRNQVDSQPTRLMQNDRWIDTSWSPDSKLLAVIYGLDGHITDVYVYGCTLTETNTVETKLYYHTPEPGTYDTKWTLNHWIDNKTISLTKEAKTEFPATITRSTVAVRIGSKPIKIDQDPQTIHFQGKS
jgi:hypothetical protein